jgi:hypothetical protein
MGGELTMDGSALRAFVGLAMLLTFGLACLDTGYAVRDIYKYRISGERVCAHIDEVAAKPIVGMGGQGRTQHWHSFATYRYTHSGKSYVGTTVWPASYEYVKSGDTSVVAATNDRLRAMTDCALITVNSKNPEDAVMFVPENSDILWMAVRRKFFVFAFSGIFYYLLLSLYKS